MLARTLTVLTASALVALSSTAARGNPNIEKKIELCVICHKVDNTLFAPALEGQTREYLYNQMLAYKEKRRSYTTMQINVASLSNDDIRAIVDYYAVQKPVRHVFPVSAEKADRGKVTADQLGCASCHQPDYSGRKEVPRLAGLNPRFLRWQLFAFSAESRPHPAISRAKPLSEAEAEDIAHFLTQLGQ